MWNVTFVFMLSTVYVFNVRLIGGLGMPSFPIIATTYAATSVFSSDVVVNSSCCWSKYLPFCFHFVSFYAMPSCFAMFRLLLLYLLLSGLLCDLLWFSSEGPFVNLSMCICMLTFLFRLVEFRFVIFFVNLIVL